MSQSQIEEDESPSFYDKKIKIMVIGETRVGKTALIKKYTKNDFGGVYLTTVGIDFQEKIINVEDKSIKLQIWDTAGEERFRNIAKNYFHTSDGFLLVYDISCRDSFEKLSFWLEQIRLNAPEHTKCIVAGNKCDLEEKREVNKNEGEDFSKENNINFFETSAKEGTNVNEIFQVLANEIIKEIQKNGEKNQRSSQVLKKGTKPKKKSCC